MSKKEKLTERLLQRPADFTFEELTTLLGQFGYLPAGAGKTGASRVAFTNGGDYIRLHKPHPRNVLKQYQVAEIIAVLTDRGLV
ncbi:hypothetical protein FACS189460_2860 [Deltaproteobacteria bacterium]|nr:hypothetical protein FACS189460_2860 [Deltaproteobacteria bacterium]